MPTTARTTAKKTTTTTKAPAKPATKASTAKAAPAKQEGKPKAAPKEPTATPVPATLVEALTSGAAQLFKVRANGTKRSLPYLKPGSTDRLQAEHVVGRRDKGETVGAIAADMNVSVATVRRFITNLLLAQEVEAGKYDAAWNKDSKEVVVHDVKKAA